MPVLRCSERPELAPGPPWVGGGLPILEFGADELHPRCAALLCRAKSLARQLRVDPFGRGAGLLEVGADGGHALNGIGGRHAGGRAPRGPRGRAFDCAFDCAGLGPGVKITSTRWAMLSVAERTVALGVAAASRFLRRCARVA